MAGFDEGNVWYSYQEQQEANTGSEYELQGRPLFAEFIQQFDSAKYKAGQKAKYIYRDELLANKTHLLIDLHHLDEWNRDLSDKLLSQPTTYLPMLEAAAVEVLSRHLSTTGEKDDVATAGVQVQLFSSTAVRGAKTMRELTSDQMSKIVVIPGIITAASKLKHKASVLTIQCSKCKGTQQLRLKPGMGGAMVPRRCTLGQQIPGLPQDCPLDPFVVLPDKSSFTDQQMLKLQERPEDIPVGDLPRTLMVVADRLLCNRVSPGTRVTAIGVYSAFKGPSGKSDRGSLASVQQPYLKLVGLREESGDSQNLFDFSQEEVHEFEEFAKQPNVHAEIYRRIAPNIFGHENIKKAIACLLFGGARKQLPDSTWRRGDINVLLLGDPSTAKSQFLKFVSKVAPVAVYTSGKGSSAAGLTASVVRDAQTREFYLEGGAMVLADNGVCCIDEFDKMRPEDRVAIHEAMEQQTISIAKAGITTMLKSRTSVLAAANPPSGRYDDLKTMAENIELQTTILSRFDLIFIVKDTMTRDDDVAIAKHVLEVHRRATGGDGKSADRPEDRQDEDFLKRYIHYCRQHCFPRLADSAATHLANAYVKMRIEARDVARDDQSGQAPVPITVRQLEALVRISEAQARMQLSTSATETHCKHSIELFNASTIDALKAGCANSVFISPEQQKETQRITEKLHRVMAIGASRSERQVVDQLVGWGENEMLVRRTLITLVQNGDLKHIHERRVLQRLR